MSASCSAPCDVMLSELQAKRFSSSSLCGVDFLRIIWSKPCKAKPEHQKRSHICHVFTWWTGLQEQARLYFDMYSWFHFCVFFWSFIRVSYYASWLHRAYARLRWNSQFCSRHSFQENPQFISRPKAKPKRNQKRSLISKKNHFTGPGPRHACFEQREK